MISYLSDVLRRWCRPVSKDPDIASKEFALNSIVVTLIILNGFFLLYHFLSVLFSLQNAFADISAFVSAFVCFGVYGFALFLSKKGYWNWGGGSVIGLYLLMAFLISISSKPHITAYLLVLTMTLSTFLYRVRVGIAVIFCAIFIQFSGYVLAQPAFSTADFHPIHYFMFMLLALGGALFIQWHFERMVAQARQQLILQSEKLKKQEALLSVVGAELQSDVNIQTETLEQTNAELQKQFEDEKRLMQETESANRAKSGFLSHMSYEIRTPMNVLIGTSELLLKSAHTSEQKEYARTLNESGHHLSSVINDILDFAEIESGHFSLKNRHVSVYPLFEGVFRMMAPQAKLKGIAFESMIAPDCPKTMDGDETKIRQVLLNLLGNALKFTEKGKISISVQYDIIERKAGGRLVISVKDTGIGIPKGSLKHIYDRFSQSDTSTTRKFGGTGLGLSISEQLVKMMDGDLQIFSEIGKGTEIILSLPCKGPTDKEEEHIQPTNHSGPSDLFASKKVLVVDDDVSITDIIKQMLGLYQCKVSVCHSGREALENVQSEEYPQLILMDCQMPTMDGPETTRHIRRFEERHGRTPVPVVALTANALVEIKQACFAAGMNDFLTKPIKLEHLEKILSAYLSGGEENQ